MKILYPALLSLCITGCASYYQPPQPASVMWKPTPQSKMDVHSALKQCKFVDRVLIGSQRVQEQAKCMRDMGFEPDFSSYSPHNCYGDAPAGCIVYWSTGTVQPKIVKPQSATPSN